MAKNTKNQSGDKLKNPSSGRVNFKEPIDQKGWNTDTNADSSAISYIGYNPETERLRVRFRDREFVDYVFRDVPVKAANKFFEATHPRKKTTPDRARSLGASFWQEVRLKRYEYSRRVLDDVPMKNVKRGRYRPDR